MLGSSDRNIAVGSVLAALIISSSFLWGMTTTGLTVFVVSCILGFIVIWLVVKSGKYSGLCSIAQNAVTALSRCQI